jgi:hypothetical protein
VFLTELADGYSCFQSYCDHDLYQRTCILLSLP